MKIETRRRVAICEIIVHCWSKYKIKNRKIKINIKNKFHENKFHENPPSGGRLVACGRTDRQADLMRLKVAVCHFTKAPKNVSRNTMQYFSGNDGNVQPNVLFPFSQ
jgi:hypothetical protein